MPRKYERMQRKAIRSFRHLTAKDELENRAHSEELAKLAFALACSVVADAEFQKILRQHGVERIPNLLLSAEKSDVHPSLKFVVAWTFYRSLLSVTAISAEIRERHPELIEQMNEAFVDLVVHGPFPPPMLLCDVYEIFDKSMLGSERKRHSRK